MTEAAAGGRRALVRSAGGVALLAGIFGVGLNLRGFVAGLPPLFREFHNVLALSPADLAIVGAIPVLCFAVFALPAAPLGRRLGEERVLGGALVALIAGLLLRGLAPGLMLYPGTIIAGAAMALGNVLLPSLVKRRQPERAGLLTGVYLAGLSLGGIAGPLIAVPVFTAAGGGAAAAQLALGLWVIPAAAAFAIWLPQLRYKTRPAAAVLPGAGLTRARRGMIRYRMAWQVAAFFGLQSMCYYASLSWLPTLLRDRGLTAAAAASLSAFAQGAGYLLASTGPILIGFLRTATGAWTIPVLTVIALAVCQLIPGWFAARPGGEIGRALPAEPRSRQGPAAGAAALAEDGQQLDGLA